MLSLKNIVLSAGDKHLFSLPELELNSGLIALVGRNGSGKSTFLRALLGEHENYTGSIQLDGREVSSYSKSDLARQISVVLTRSEVFGSHTAHEVLMLGRLPKQGMLSKPSADDLEKVEAVISQLELEELRDRIFHQLSDGEKQLVMIGRALVQDTPLILLDEPGAFLDLVNRVKLIQLLKKVTADSQKLIIFSTHHLDVLDANCSGLLLIAKDSMVLKESQFESVVRESFGI